jgi:hypothetical protein
MSLAGDRRVWGSQPRFLVLDPQHGLVLHAQNARYVSHSPLSSLACVSYLSLAGRAYPQRTFPRAVVMIDNTDSIPSSP